MTLSTLTLRDATCSLCANKVSVALHAVEGVRHFDVDLADQTAVVTFDDDVVDRDHICRIIGRTHCHDHGPVM